MRITQGTFSYLPDLTDEEITAQVQYTLDRGWPISVEFTDDPHPRNTYWEMWGLPMFDIRDAAGVMHEISECRKAYPGRYIRVSAYDASKGRQTTRCRSSSTARPTSPASGWTGRRSPTGGSATRRTPTQPTGRRATATPRRDHSERRGSEHQAVVRHARAARRDPRAR